MFEGDLSDVMIFIGEVPDAFAILAFPPDMNGIGVVGDEGAPSWAIETFHAGRFRARWEKLCCHRNVRYFSNFSLAFCGVILSG